MTRTPRGEKTLHIQQQRPRVTLWERSTELESTDPFLKANRMFGHDGWDRELPASRCIYRGSKDAMSTSIWLVRVQLRLRADKANVVREALGVGEGTGATLGQAHQQAAAAAESAAMTRALMTFGTMAGLPGSSGMLDLTPTVTLAGDDVGVDIPEYEGKREERPKRALTGARGRNNRRRHSRIDKSVLKFGVPRRLRDPAHLKYVANQCCLVCGRQPGHAHHLRFAQPRAIGKKVSDEWVVPLCAIHHRAVHEAGNETAWWDKSGTDSLAEALRLWKQSRCID